MDLSFLRRGAPLLALALLACSSGNGNGNGPDSACPDAQCAAGDAALADTSARTDATSMDAPSLDAPSSDGPGSDASPDASGGDSAPDGPPPCPLYQARCAGACLPVSVDPRNCGGCGVTCATGQVCSGGACTDHCLTGLSACAGSCVDTQSDSAHCGACGTACGAGMGCVAGRCERAVILDPTAVRCAGGGPPVDFGGYAGGATRCAGAVAETSFRWALCSCQNVELSSPLLTDAFDSTRGPYVPGGLGGGVGANNRFSNSNQSDIYGALWTGSTMGWGFSSPQDVRMELRVNGPLVSSGTLAARDEAYVNGNVQTSSTVAVTGALHVPASAAVSAGVTYRRLTREPVTVSPPCDCDASAFVPIAAIVAEARTRNDNAALGLDPNELTGINTARRIDLPCGRYYLSQVSSSAPITIVAHGRTALFIGGDVTVSQALTITLDPTAELDLVVAGTLGTSAPLTLGSPNYPALTRVYLGSSMGFRVSNTATLGANFYVPNGMVGTSAPFELYGGVFAGNFQASNSVRVHYDRAVLRAGDPCRNPGTPSGDGGVSTDAGSSSEGGASPDSGTPGCTTCRDCANQACVGGTCGSCTTDSQCCAPLRCFEGSCVLVPG